QAPKKKNSPHNIESVQEKFTTHRRNAQRQALENLLHNAECAQGQAPESLHTMPNMPKDNTRRFTTPRTNTKDLYTEKMPEDKHQKIHNTELRIHLILLGEHRDTLYNVKSS
ncbi:2547_t:CDS:2, partial [Dentiscutata heterogama]